MRELVPPMDEPRLLGGRYRIGEVLGRGGMATVRLGVDERLGRTVAVKILRADLEAAPSFRARFRREARAAAALDHPSIVTVYDTGEDVVDGMTVPYIVMEYVDGRTLSELQRADERIPPDRALAIMAEVLGALEYSHRAGIVHRDVKPANIMLTPTGAVKVMDFGIARVATETAGTMTGGSQVIGTAHYLSPEQARGEGADARSDVYSAGCTLYALLANRPPFLGDSAVSVAYQHVREEPLPPSTYAPGIPPAAEAIVMKALAKAPEDRYESAAAMRADLLRALAGEPVEAAPVAVAATVGDSTAIAADAEDTRNMPVSVPGATGPSADGARSRRRRAAAPAAIAAVLVALIAVAAFAFGDIFGPTERPQRGEGPLPERAVPAKTERGSTAEETAESAQTTDDSDSDGGGAPVGETEHEPAEKPQTPNSTPTESESDRPTDSAPDGEETSTNPPTETEPPAEETPTETEPPAEETPTETEPPAEETPTETEPPAEETPTEPPAEETSPPEQPEQPDQQDQHEQPEAPADEGPVSQGYV